MEFQENYFKDQTQPLECRGRILGDRPNAGVPNAFAEVGCCTILTGVGLSVQYQNKPFLLLDRM